MPPLYHSLFSLLPATSHLADGFKPTELCPAILHWWPYCQRFLSSEGWCSMHNTQRPFSQWWVGLNSNSGSALQVLFTWQAMQRECFFPLHLLTGRGNLSLILARPLYNLSGCLSEGACGVFAIMKILPVPSNIRMHSWGYEPTG